MAVDQDLVSKRTYRSISDQYGLSMSALKRHKAAHLSGRLFRAQQALEVKQADELVEHRDALETADMAQAIDMVQQLKAINAACLELLKKARESQKPAVMLAAVDRISRQIEIQGRWLRDILRSEEELKRRVSEKSAQDLILMFEVLKIFAEPEIADRVIEFWAVALGFKEPPADFIIEDVKKIERAVAEGRYG